MDEKQELEPVDYDMATLKAIFTLEGAIVILDDAVEAKDFRRIGTVRTALADVLRAFRPDKIY